MTDGTGGADARVTMTRAGDRFGPEYEPLGTWWTFDAPSLRVVDRHLRYVSVWCAGDGGPSLLLVHTSTADHEAWSSLVPDLVGHFTVHAVDLRADTVAARPDVDAVTTALDAVGAGLVVADRDAARTVLEATATSPVSSAVLWEPPGDVVVELRSVVPRVCTVHVFTSSASVVAALGPPDEQVHVHSRRGPAGPPTTQLTRELPGLLLNPTSAASRGQAMHSQCEQR